MGTEIQYAVDLLTPLKKRKYSCGAVRSPGSSEVVKKILPNQKLASPPDQLQLSMDRLKEHINREAVRTTILKQEEIFKQQVHELHRLYNVQRMLMAEVRKNKAKLESMNSPSPKAAQVRHESIQVDSQNKIWSTTRTGLETNTSPFGNWNHSPQSQTHSAHNFHQLFSVRTNPSSQEQSSTSCSRQSVRMSKGLDLEIPVEEVSTVEDQAGSSSMRFSDQHGFTDDEKEVELTLSIGFGGAAGKKKPTNCQPHPKLEFSCSESNFNQSRQKDSSMSVRSDRRDDCSDRSNSTGGTANAAFDQENVQRPPWLFQTLSLNRT